MGKERLKRSYSSSDFVEYFNRFWLLIVLLVIAFTHSININAQIVDPHAWRQAQTAWTVEGWLENSFKPFSMYLPIKGTLTTWNMEFPLVQYVAYTIALLTGFSPELSLRIIGLFSLFVTCIAIDMILKKFISKTKRHASIVIFCLSPYVLWWWSTGLIDLTATALGMLGMAISMNQQFQEKKKNIWIFIALNFLLSTLIKPSIGFLYLCWLFLFNFITKKYKTKINVEHNHNLLTAIIGSGIGLACYMIWTRTFANSLNQNDPRQGWLLNENNFSFYFGSNDQYLNPWTYFFEIGNRLLPATLGYVGITVILISTIAKLNLLAISGLVSVSVSLYIFINLNYVHDYYQIAVVPILFIAFLISLNEISVGRTSRKKYYYVILFLTISMTFTFDTSQGYVKSLWNKPWLPPIMLEIVESIPKGKEFICIGCGETPYYSYLMKSETYMANSFSDLRYAIERNFVPNYEYILVTQDYKDEVLVYFKSKNVLLKPISENVYKFTNVIERDPN